MKKNAIFYFFIFIFSFLSFYTLKNNYLFKKNNPPSINKEKSENLHEEIILVFITSSSCIFSNHDDLPPALNSLIKKIKNRSENLNYSFSTIGISIDETAATGLKHLEKFGEFDEIIIGSEWNVGSTRYIYNNIHGPASTPQILITKREYNTIKFDILQRIGIDNEYQVIRKAGLNSIFNWDKNGAPLPNDI